jgi:hypothetical protein
LLVGLARQGFLDVLERAGAAKLAAEVHPTVEAAVHAAQRSLPPDARHPAARRSSTQAIGDLLALSARDLWLYPRAPISTAWRIGTLATTTPS